MPKLKLLLSLFLGLAVVFAQVGAVQAAPAQQDGASITGTVQSVVFEPSLESGTPTVVISLLVNGETQKVRVSLETAIGLGLIALDEDGNPALDENGYPVVDDTLFGTDVEIDLTTILPDGTPAPEEKQHPVGTRITEFFSNFFNVDYELVMSSHSNGFGFGIITQALWMTEKLGGDATLFQTILEAKKNHDYTGVALPDGSIPQNWGQLKKALLQGNVDESLGEIVSGDTGNQGNSGNGKPDEPGNGNPANLGNGNGNSNRPDTPPGRDKDKNNNGNGKTK